MNTNKTKGAMIYSVKNDGSLYKHPEMVKFIGGEKSAEDVIVRLEKLNPGRKFVAAQAC